MPAIGLVTHKLCHAIASGHQLLSWITQAASPTSHAVAPDTQLVGWRSFWTAQPPWPALRFVG